MFHENPFWNFTSVKPLDDAIDTFIKVLLQEYTFNSTECVLFSLPVEYGGMGLIIPLKICQEEYENSQEITKETTNKVIRNEIQFQHNRISTTKIKNSFKRKSRTVQNCEK